MDTYEATQVVMSRIQSLDPESASKIMGYILIQDQGEKEIIRLAFVPDSILLSYINQAKACLGITPSSKPFSSPRILIPNNGFHFSNPSPSRSSPTPTLSPSPSPSPRPFSYAAALNGSTANANSPASSFNFYGAGGAELPFLDDSAVDPVMSPSGRSDSLLFPYGEEPSPHPFHRRSSSVNDAAFLANMEEGGGFGWRPCMYFARGFCKNGTSCKFLHGGDGDAAAPEVGSPGKGFDDLLRMKALQQHRFALMASSPRGQQHFSYNKCMDFLNDNPRNEFSGMGLGAAATSSSRQIYLTFPADSTFKEEDVSSYFSMFGPVQDVRIPFQQKRMFGFVTFVYPETVKLILAKGNPHFVCDSRVLVKPYKEKGKVADKKQQQQHHLDLSSSVIESRENIDLPFGSRMLFNTQEMMLRRKLEQEAEIQHAIELQGRRIMNLHLMDLKNQHHNHHLLQGFRAGIPMSSPRQSQFLMNQNFIPSPEGSNQENTEEFDGWQEPAKSPNLVPEGSEFSNNIVGCDKQIKVNGDDSNIAQSFDHILPDNLFASPTKLAGEHRSVFSEASASTDDSIPITITSSSKNIPTMASLKSCYVEIPRFSSGQEAIEM
ncbi:zinc finger CCCH domain-containing protein 22-like [Salvia miltiorrhiza]|uniref:zinc finger CCCH domain-containing protein 22-like n=1 Tax=Salvia miltiorrhiza TaxID=226208 RepID=UPI0025AB7FEF|nr:zinc finger CCCH domain-containing protein 22-like [Salvia miltiorrhiza]